MLATSGAAELTENLIGSADAKTVAHAAQPAFAAVLFDRYFS